MSPATDATRVERLEREGGPGRPGPDSGDAHSASSGGDRYPTIGPRHPRIEFDTLADREGAK